METFEAELRTEYTRITSLSECVGKTISYAIESLRAPAHIGLRFTDRTYFYARAELGHLNIVVDLDAETPINETVALELGIIGIYEAERYHLAKLCKRGVVESGELEEFFEERLKHAGLSVHER